MTPTGEEIKISNVLLYSRPAGPVTLACMTADAATAEDPEAKPTSPSGPSEFEAVVEADTGEDGTDDLLLDGYLPL